MKIFTAFVMILAIAPPANRVMAGNDVVVGQHVEATSRISIQSVDHAQWNDLLGRYVDRSGRVDYAGWKRTATDVKNLDDYLKTLSTGDPSVAASNEARLAFWINAYNAVTVRGILREYPTTSIRNHTAKLFGYNIWDDLLLHVGERTYSLNQMEHEILRKMDEPRIHFAIVCASVGCPPLRSEAYLPEKIDQQLQSNAKAFFADEKNFRFDEKAERFHLSSILDWFGEDFGDDRQAQLRRISAWLPTATARSAGMQGKVSVRYIDYDWSLNGQ